MNKIFDGRKEALIIKEVVRKNSLGKNLTLGIIQVGDDHMSNIFIREKMNFARDVGIDIKYKKLNEGSSQLDEYIDIFNEDERINAYLIQLPILGFDNPKHFLEKIDPQKDIDCLTSINYSKLLIGDYTFAPGVYSAFIYIFDKLEVSRKSTILIVGSGFVGLGILNYLAREKYNVSIIDKYLEDISPYSKNADVIIFSAGVSNIIKEHDVKKGSILINIGASANLDGTFSGGISEEASKKSKFFVPSKGGIGPMTVAMLFYSLSENN